VENIERVYWTVSAKVELATREEALRVAAAIQDAVPEAEVTIAECEEFEYVPWQESE